MGLAIDESEEVENSTEVINRSSRLRKKPRDFAETPIDQEIGKTDNDRSRGIGDQVFSALIAEIVGHDVSDCWLIKRKEND